MVERIIEACARHHLVVIFAVLCAGVGSFWAIRNVKVDAIPDLSDPQVIVFTEWMGRSPTLVEDQVTYPIVSSLVGGPHVNDVRGFSMFGMSFIYVLFDEGTDIYWARSRVLETMNGMQGRLPDGVTPTLGPDATGIGWVFQYTLVDDSGTHSLDELRTFQDFTLKNALGSVRGVAEVASIGGYEKQYQVTVDPVRLRAFDVTLPEEGYYKLFSDFVPYGGAAQFIAAPLVTSGYAGDLMGDAARLVADESATLRDGDLTARVSHDPATFAAGLYAHLRFDVTETDTGRPVTDLEPYLGSFGHIVIMSEDLVHYVHSHPLDLARSDDETGPLALMLPMGVDPSDLRGGPTLTFEGLMPKPGLYRAWAQFQRDGEVHTFAHTFAVGEREP